MQTIYIFGHKKPDTDSICSSISLSYLKNKLGVKTEPRTLGNINKETQFVLDYFNLKQPKYLNDVKLQIKDIDYRKNCFLSYKNSIQSCFNYMNKNDLTGLPIINDNKKLYGLVTLKELAKELIKGDFRHLNTSYENILETLEGEEVLKFDSEIEGNIKIAAYKTATIIDHIEINNDDILIVGDRNNILEYVIKKGLKLIILVGNGELSENNLELAKEYKVNIIRTSHDTFFVSKHIGLSNYVANVSFTSPITIHDFDYYTSFKEIIDKTKHTNYPVLNKKGECLGLFPITLTGLKNRKKVILVDHNEQTQSADGLDEAEILGIVDHHKLGTISTALPINFRNMAVGSANTIIYNLYNENNIEIPKDIAGAMLSGILSDTLILKSPTTTDVDREAVKVLEKIAEVDHYKYGMDMFKAGSSLKGLTTEEIIFQDFKTFNTEFGNIGVGQVLTMDCETILDAKEEYINKLNETTESKDYKMVLLFVTDIINNGSYILYNDGVEDILRESFKDNNLTEGYYLKDIVSRKKQIMPPILDVIEKK